jgi:hypothetical protein
MMGPMRTTLGQLGCDQGLLNDAGIAQQRLGEALGLYRQPARTTRDRKIGTWNPIFLEQCAALEDLIARIARAQFGVGGAYGDIIAAGKLLTSITCDVAEKYGRFREWDEARERKTKRKRKAAKAK